LDLKIFRTSDGRILQLADKNKMNNWDAEMPLIFIGSIREKRLSEYRKEYPKSLVKNVEAYLDEILKEVAIPKLISALSSKNKEEKMKVAENMVKLSESNVDQLKIALPHIQKAMSDPDKNFAGLMKKIDKNYQKAQKKKQTAVKRKKLSELRKKMDGIDRNFADGKINDTQYLKEQKLYLKLKREIELEEQL
jgi:hypothetical protein